MISIITPVYNGIRFIDQSIQVVIDQHCAEAEHIIVDGGSIDGTVDIIKRYADQYPHIRWVSEPDQGQSDAMNKGLALARGEIVGFLNVDDFYEPNVLNRVVDIFKTLPEPSMLVGNCNVWDSQGNLMLVNKPRRLNLADLVLGPNLNPFPVNPSAYFCHASLFRMIAPFDVNDHYTMDIEFLLRAVQVAAVTYVDETWGNFRMLPTSKTVNDIANGQTSRRQDLLFRRGRRNLPKGQRWRVAAHYALYNHVWLTIKYFASHPRELPGRLYGRLRQAAERNRVR